MKTLHSTASHLITRHCMGVEKSGKNTLCFRSTETHFSVLFNDVIEIPCIKLAAAKNRSVVLLVESGEDGRFVLVMTFADMYRAGVAHEVVTRAMEESTGEVFQLEEGD